MQKEVAFAAKQVVVVVEEIVDEEVIRRDPNRTLIPGLVVDAVVHEPYGAHPSYVQGYYDRDNALYLAWDKISRDEQVDEGMAGRMGVWRWKIVPPTWTKLGAGYLSQTRCRGFAGRTQSITAAMISATSPSKIDHQRG